jgi:hypothetical protein
MRRAIFSGLLGLTLLAAGPVAAQTGKDADMQKRLTLASELITVLNLRPLLAQLEPGAVRGIVGAVEQQTRKPVPEATQKTIQDVVHRKMAEKLPDLIPTLAPATAEAFTTEEIQSLLDFYKSAPGQTILAKLPSYQTQSGRLMTTWMQQNLSGLERSIVEELKAKGVEVPMPQQQSQQQPK